MAYTFTTKLSPNYERNNAPNKIIVHHWGQDGQKFDNVVYWLCNPNAEVSAHYVLEAGRVCQLVEEKNRAWHCVGQNSVSIGIECRPECTSGDLQTLAELIAAIWLRRGKLPIYGHKDFNNTACPGRYYGKLATIKAMAEKIYNGETPTPTPTKKGLEVDGILGELSITALQKWLGTYQDGYISGQMPYDERYLYALQAVEYGSGGSACIKALQTTLKKAGFTPGAVDGYIGQNTVKALQRFLNHQGNKLDVDGYLGEKTASALQKYLNKVVYGV